MFDYSEKNSSPTNQFPMRGYSRAAIAVSTAVAASSTREVERQAEHARSAAQHQRAQRVDLVGQRIELRDGAQPAGMIASG